MTDDVQGLDDIDFSKFPRIVSTTVQNQVPRIQGTETTVFDVSRGYEKYDLSAEKMANDYAVSLSEIFEALAFYYDFREELTVAKENRDW